MKKRMTILIAVLLCMALLAGCMCKHETWKEATCTDPRTCAECGETEGVALGHVEIAATCETPKTCEVCGFTEGEALGHDMVEATCEEAKHCTRCDLTEGEALGHAWQEATTELPQTCAACGITEGERIITDARFTTAATKEIQGVWICDVPLTSQELGLDVDIGSLTLRLIVDLRNDGKMVMSAELPDEKAFIEKMIDGYVEYMYEEFQKQGLDREAADAAMIETYGMDVKDYLTDALGEISFNEILATMYEEMDLGGVYYMEEGKLFTGLTWEGTMMEESYTLDGDTLIIDSINEELGINIVLTRQK